MSGTRANPRKYDPSDFPNAKIHKLQVTALFEEAWCSYRHFRFFFNSSFFIFYLFGAQYANQDILPSSSISKKAKLDIGIIDEIHYRSARYITE